MTDAPPARPSPPHFPPSGGQRRLARPDLDPASYVAGAAIAISGTVEVDRLERAITAVIEAYEVLRTVVEEVPGVAGVRQVVYPVTGVPLDIVDDPTWAPTPLNAGIAHGHPVGGAAQKPFSATLVRIGPGRSYLTLSGSGSCVDAKSLDLLAGRIMELYAEDQGGSGNAALEDADILQYADVTEWENGLASSDDGKPGWEFWRGSRWPSDFAKVLPFERGIETAGHNEVDAVSLDLDAETVAALTAAAGLSSEAVLLAAHFVLVWRVANRVPVILDVASNGRGYEALADAVGPYARDLPLHVDIQAEQSFSSIASRVAAGLREAREWEQLYDPTLLTSGLSGGAGMRLPFGFEFQTLGHARTIEGVSFDPVALGQGARGHGLMFSVRSRSDRTEYVVLFDPTRYDRRFIESLTGSLQAILKSAAEDLETPVGRLDLLLSEERQRLVVEPNATVTDYPRDRLLHEFMEEQVRLHPDRVAVEFDGRALTYRELDQRSNRLAHHLIASGVQPDTLVAIFADRSFEMIVAVFGVLKAGGGYVPLSPSYPADRLSFILDQTRTPVLVTTADLRDRLPAHQARLVVLDSDWEEIEGHPDTAPARTATPDNVAYVIFTSGSTGEPKGVVVTHRTFVISNEARIEYYGRDVAKYLLLSPFAFDSSIVGISWTLTVGGTLSLIGEDVQRDLAELCAYIERQGVSHILTLPSFYNVLLSHGETGQLTGLRTVIVAGEACPLDMVRRHKRLLPGTGLYSEYGATETTIWSSAYDCLQQTIDTAPLGKPIANCEMYVLDPDLQPLPVGIPGEVHFGGAILARGYWNRPDLTAERFIPSPFSDDPNARLYRSGDLARFLPNGDMEFLGRLDNQVKIRGFRVELEEIEIALATHPDLGEVAVAARDAAEWDVGGSSSSGSSESKRLVGYVCPRTPPGPTSSDLRDFLSQRVPSYMVPVAFVTLDRLPKTPNGKLDRAALPPIDPAALDRPRSEGEAPATPAEEALAHIWKRVLGVSEVSRDDNFFELGGDSILSIQVVALANKEGVQISARDVFELQTIAALASSAGASQPIVAEQGLVDGDAPLHPIQHWFFEQERPDPHHANMSALLQIERPLDPEVLRSVVTELQVHHDALRLRFQRSATGWAQTHGATASANTFQVVDLSDVKRSEQSEAVEAEARRAQMGLDLESGDLLRVIYFDLGEEEPARLLVVAHHLAFDGVSLRIFLEDLQDGYADAVAGRTPRFPLKTTSYKAWNESLVAYAATPKVLDEADYWYAVGPTDLKPIPMDFEGGPQGNTFADQRVVSRSLSAAETLRLLREVPNAYQSRIDEVLLAALVQTMCEWSGHDGLSLELEGHGREPLVDGVDVSRTVGWFTTVYPAYLSLERSQPLGSILQSIMAQLRSIPDKGAGYGVLRYLADEAVRAKLAGRPRPPVNFNYLGQFDQVLGDTGLLVPAPESAGPDFSVSASRPHLIEIVASVIEGSLRVEWMYGSRLHEEATIQGLADGFMKRLSDLVDHCTSGAADGVLSADANDFEWDQSDLDDIAAAVLRARGGA